MKARLAYAWLGFLVTAMLLGLFTWAVIVDGWGKALAVFGVVAGIIVLVASICWAAGAIDDYETRK